MRIGDTGALIGRRMIISLFGLLDEEQPQEADPIRAF